MRCGENLFAYDDVSLCALRVWDLWFAPLLLAEKPTSVYLPAHEREGEGEESKLNDQDEKEMDSLPLRSGHAKVSEDDQNNKLTTERENFGDPVAVAD